MLNIAYNNNTNKNKRVKGYGTKTSQLRVFFG